MKTTDASITNPENKFDLHSNSGFAGFAYLWQYTLLLLTVCSLFAYESLVDDLNVDPNNPTTASPNLLDPESENYRGNAKTDETARFKYYYISDDVGQIRGDIEPNFLTEEARSKPDGFFGMETSFPLITYEENLLILAEAGLRTAGFATGLQHLNEYREFLAEGGSLNPEYLPDGELEFSSVYQPYEETDFVTGTGIVNTEGLAPDRALLKEILEERYLAFIGQIEGFNDLRRTYPETDVRVNLPPNTGNQLPLRFLYPQTEIDNNASTPQPIPGLFDPTPVNQ